MNKHFIFMFIVILSFSSVFALSGSDYFTELISNTPYIDHGEAVFKLTNPNSDNLIVSSEKLGFDFKEVKNGIKEYQIYYLNDYNTTESYISDYNKINCINETNETNITEVCENDAIYSDRTVNIQEWLPLTEYIVNGYESVQIKIIGIYDYMAVGSGVSIDWIPKITDNTGFLGLWSNTYNEPSWAWWNISYNSCRNITIELGANKNDYPTIKPDSVGLNITGLTGNTGLIRIVNNSCGNSGSEIPRDILQNNTTWAEVIFLVSGLADTNITYSVYYNSSSATIPTYTTDLNCSSISLDNSFLSMGNRFYTTGDWSYGGTDYLVNKKGNNTRAITSKAMEIEGLGTSAPCVSIMNGSVMCQLNCSNGTTSRVWSFYAYNPYYDTYLKTSQTSTAWAGYDFTGYSLSAGGTITLTHNNASVISGWATTSTDSNWYFVNSTSASTSVDNFGLIFNSSLTGSKNIQFHQTPIIRTGENPVNAKTITGTNFYQRFIFSNSSTYNASGFKNVEVELINDPFLYYIANEEIQITPYLNLTVNSPSNNTNNLNVQNQDFSFTTVSNALANCSLYVNNTVVNTTTANNETATVLSYSPFAYQTDYLWYINCTTGTVSNITDIYSIYFDYLTYGLVTTDLSYDENVNINEESNIIINITSPVDIDFNWTLFINGATYSPINTKDIIITDSGTSNEFGAQSIGNEDGSLLEQTGCEGLTEFECATADKPAYTTIFPTEPIVITPPSADTPQMANSSFSFKLKFSEAGVYNFYVMTSSVQNSSEYFSRTEAGSINVGVLASPLTTVASESSAIDFSTIMIYATVILTCLGFVFMVIKG